MRLHEARGIGTGASGRNGGFALRGGAMAYDVAVEQLGRATARALWRLTEDGLRPDGRARRRRLPANGKRSPGRRRGRGDGAAPRVRRAGGGRPRRRVGRCRLRPASGSCFPRRSSIRRWSAPARPLGPANRGRWPPTPASRSASTAGWRWPTCAPSASSLQRTATAPGSARPRRWIRPARAQVLVTEPLPEERFFRPHYARHGFDYWHRSRTADW